MPLSPDLKKIIDDEAEKRFPIEFSGAGLSDGTYHLYRQAQEKSRHDFSSGYQLGLERCIEFVEWCADNNYIYVANGNWFHSFDKTKTPTTSQLLIEFLKTKNKKE